MAWMKRLAETYDLYQDLAGIVKDGQPVLLPVSHSTINAQIEVTLNEKGEFVQGKVVEKGDEVTIIPVTEDSAARSSGVAPHPLCDKLCYVAIKIGTLSRKKPRDRKLIPIPLKAFQRTFLHL